MPPADTLYPTTLKLIKTSPSSAHGQDRIHSREANGGHFLRLITSDFGSPQPSPAQTPGCGAAAQHSLSPLTFISKPSPFDSAHRRTSHARFLLDPSGCQMFGSQKPLPSKQHGRNLDLLLWHAVQDARLPAHSPWAHPINQQCPYEHGGLPTAFPRGKVMCC